jgi:prepilin-type N-terminal cleavage/methylation domain-containing protein
MTRTKGFSLIELLVVTTIIAVILSAVVVSFQRANQSARDAKRKSDITELKGILENYRLETGEYPDTVVGLSDSSYDESSDGTFLEALSPTYKSRPYNDPLPDQEELFYYRYKKHDLPGCQYELGTLLETDNTQPCPSSCGITSPLHYYCLTD